MVTDYEAAYNELERYVGTKREHGRSGLQAEMTAIRARNAVDESFLRRVLRLYLPALLRGLDDTRDTGSSVPSAAAPAPREDADTAPGHPNRTTEVHDGPHRSLARSA